MPSDGQQVSQQSLEIKQNDKFFTRIMSKESSMANSSNRVYYGGASGAVPFMWESRPGTPKHTLADTCIPPLTPPPSYHSSSKSNSMHKNNANPNIFTTLFQRFLPKRTRLMDDYDHNDGHGLRSPISTLCCDVKRKAVSGCLGYHFMRNMKSAVS
ncbi:hypothetical protein POTOM_044302 [Populus tomentosa]|uniref:Uncharacterized protein n=1 Tax=Populus tomentosa TaxID=118781 RepID=A0A8X7YFW5_POPTO|nr:hypothetical protein POTOM_044302 [Populus tomentosa]